MQTPRYTGVIKAREMGGKGRFRGRKLPLNSYASSEDGRAILIMKRNGNLEWGIYRLTKDGSDKLNVRYEILFQSNTTVKESVARNQGYYAWYGPVGIRNHRDNPPTKGPHKLQIRKKSGSVKTISPKGAKELHLGNNGVLAGKSNDHIQWSEGKAPAKILKNAFIPNANTLVIATNGISLSQGTQTIHNDTPSTMVVFDGKNVEILDPGQAAHHSHPGVLDIYMANIPLLPMDDGDILGSAAARNTKKIPANNNYVSVSSLTVFDLTF